MSTQPITPSAAPQAAEAPQMSDAQLFAMPMEDLKQAAGIGQPQTAEPAPVQQQPAQTATEKFTISQDDNGVVITLSPEYGGEVYKGKDLAEVVNRIASVNADKNAYIKQLKANPQQPQQQPQNQEPQIDPAALAAAHEMASPEQQAANKKELAEFFRDVLTPEVKQQIVSEALGVTDPRFLPQTVQTVSNAAAEWQANNLLMEFHRTCTDYLDTPENTKALYEETLAGKPQGYIPTVNDLVTGWAVARYKGTGTPHDPQAQPRVSRPPVMPSAGGAAASHSAAGDPWTMPLEDLGRLAGIK